MTTTHVLAPPAYSVPWKEMLVVASGAGLFALFKQWAANEGYLVRLDVHPPPEAFDMDVSLARCFQKLARYKAVDPDAYMTALRATDRLLLLEKRLVKGEIKPRFGDTVAARVNIDRVSNRLFYMARKCEEAGHYHMICRMHAQIYRHLKRHYQVIRSKCETIRPD